MLRGIFYFSPGAINNFYVCPYNEYDEVLEVSDMDVMVRRITCGKINKCDWPRHCPSNMRYFIRYLCINGVLQ